MTAFKSISPQWWGAIAAAVAAGAAVFADHRILGGLAAGGAMLYLAKKASAPCCAACAGETEHDATESSTLDLGELFGLSSSGLSGNRTPSSTCVGCASGGGLLS